MRRLHAHLIKLSASTGRIRAKSNRHQCMQVNEGPDAVNFVLDYHCGRGVSSVSTAPRLVADVVTGKLDERGGARKLHSRSTKLAMRMTQKPRSFERCLNQSTRY